MQPIRLKTVKIISQLLKPFVSEGVVLVSEEQAIISNLKYLAEKGELIPPVMPKLIDQAQAAEMLSLSLSNFKKIEREGGFPFCRKMVGSSVRYRNTDITAFILAENTLQNDEE